MCGIFGIFLQENNFFSGKRLNLMADDLFKLSESRGKEAAGVIFLLNKKI